MDVNPWTNSAALFLLVFGTVALATTLGVAVHKATLVDDVWSERATFQDPTDPATSTDADVRSDWRDVQVIDAWEPAMHFAGTGSILAAILLTTAGAVRHGISVLRIGMPRFWSTQLARWADRGDDRQPPAHAGPDTPDSDRRALLAGLARMAPGPVDGVLPMLAGMIAGIAVPLLLLWDGMA